MSTSNQYSPPLWWQRETPAVATPKTRRRPIRQVIAGTGSLPQPDENCARCGVDITALWHVAQLCDACVEYEIKLYKRKPK